MTVELVKKKYPIGTRIKLIARERGELEWLGLKAGDLGTVKGVGVRDGVILVEFDNGFTTLLTPGADRFSVVFGKAAEKQA